MTFFNSRKTEMSFEDVIDGIIYFIKQDPTASYKLAIGTDSQVRSYTKFVTAIHVHRTDQNGIGKGAWGCLREVIVERHIESLREKIFIETSLTQTILYMFDYDRLSKLLDVLIPNDDIEIGLVIEAHLDIGKKGDSREYISESLRRFEGMDVKAKIKPNAYVASKYADRYTK